jgi:hypothetical protein
MPAVERYGAYEALQRATFMKPLWIALTLMHLLAGIRAVQFYLRNP